MTVYKDGTVSALHRHGEPIQSAYGGDRQYFSSFVPAGKNMVDSFYLGQFFAQGNELIQTGIGSSLITNQALVSQDVKLETAISRLKNGLNFTFGTTAKRFNNMVGGWDNANPEVGSTFVTTGVVSKEQLLNKSKVEIATSSHPTQRGSVCFYGSIYAAALDDKTIRFSSELQSQESATSYQSSQSTMIFVYGGVAAYFLTLDSITAY